MNSCPINGCGVPIAQDRLMCAAHWWMVPKPLRNTIWLLWQNGHPKEGHREACRSAIEQVNGQENRA
jgi:hypothetical protein